MWVETDTGTVNLEHVMQVTVEFVVGPSLPAFSLGFWLPTGGYTESREKFDTREEARQAIKQMTEKINHPLRVVQRGAQHDEDTAGEGA